MNFERVDVAFAKEVDVKIEEELSQNVEDLLSDIDSSGLDNYLEDGAEFGFFEIGSFKEFVVMFLSGEYYQNYDSIFDAIKTLVQNKFKSVFSFIVLILSLIVLYEIFNSFCIDKYLDLKKSIKIIFSIVIILIVITQIQKLADDSILVVKKIFSFTELLFPILLNLILLGGASGCFASYGLLSSFLINTGSYVVVYVLSPLVLSILMLSIFGSIFQTKRFDKVANIFQSLFKWIIGIFISLVALVGTVNFITAKTTDGLGFKLTKFAIKNYVPVLGGYISDGFDFVKTGSLIIKNAFGIGGIIVLFTMILKPILSYVVYLFVFKILSIISIYISGEFYSNIFDNVSKGIGYLIALMVGVFLILFFFLMLIIMSISVV